MICGSYPPEHCGIGDYAYQLVRNLEIQGNEVVVMANIDWSVKNFFSIIKNVRVINADVIHIQYPGINYQLSIMPQLISLFFRSFVTTHEVSQIHFVRKLSLIPFALRSKVVFTNIFERDRFVKLFPWFRKKNTVIIPIGSNINANEEILVENKRINEIISFGQIRPDKGIEQVINLSKRIKENELPYRIIIVGQLLPKFKQYFNKLKELSIDLDIEWKLNLPESGISTILSSSLIAYLPYPDGVSERRGSLLASLKNQMFVITTDGQQATQDLKDCVHIVSDNTDVIDFLKNNNEDSIVKILESKKELSNAYMARLEWPNIAMEHIKNYIPHSKEG